MPLNLSEFKQVAGEITPLLDERMVFILGFSKSGKSRLEHCLVQDPAMHGMGDCHFWEDLGPMLRKGLEQLYAEQKARGRRRGAEAPEKSYEVADLFYATAFFMGLALRRKDAAKSARYILETSPDKADLLEELAALFPKAKFILMLRDGRDGLAALWHHEMKIFERNGEKPLFEDMAAFADGHYGPRWKEQLSWYLDFADSRPDRCHVIRYEDLYQDQDRILSNLAPFLPEADLSVMKWPDLPDDDHQAYQRPGGWRDGVPEAALEAFLTHAGDVMKRAGY